MELTITKDTNDLERLERVIHKNLRSFYEVGRALMEIKERELYKIKNGGEYETFAAYCRGVWDMSKTHANYLIASNEVMDNLTAVAVTKPETERHIRALAKLGPKEQIEAWQKAVETAPNGKVTAAHVTKVVNEMRKKEEPKRTSRIGNEVGNAPPTFAMQISTMAISQLERINLDDPKRMTAFKRVEKWIQDHIYDGRG